MEIFDISLTLDNHLATWPGDPAVDVHRVHKLEEGANANVSQVCMGLHTGTHVDAPYHFLQNGSTVEKLPLEILIGPVQVIRLPSDVDIITAETIQSASILPNIERVLFKTRNSSLWRNNPSEFHTDFVGIDLGGAEALVTKGIRLVGIDYLSVSPYHMSRPTHVALLEAGVVILEGLDLSGVEAGEYELCCLPVKFGGADGAPARAVLIAKR